MTDQDKKKSMVLEDFFTLTEMKDGLTTIARVEELLAVMQTTECIMTNAGDTSRQWSSVATVLAATGSGDCLSHFVQSDGLRFLGQWLQVAQECSGDKSDSIVESISGLLGALQKLPVDKERLTTSRVKETVRHLFTHKSSEVQERARSVFDAWTQVEDKERICQNVSKGGACPNVDNNDLKSSDDIKVVMKDGCSKSPLHDTSPVKESAEGSVLEHSKATTTSDVSKFEIIKDIKIPTSNQDTIVTTLNQAEVNGQQGDVNSFGSLMSNACAESSTITEQSSLCHVEGTTSVGTCNSLIVGDRNLDCKSSDASELKDMDIDDRSSEDNKTKEIEMSMRKEGSATYSKLDHLDSSSTFPLNAQNSLNEPDESCDVGVKESPLCKTESVGLVDDHSAKEPQPKSGAVDCVTPQYLRSTTDSRPVVQDGKCDAKFLQDLTNADGQCEPTKPESAEIEFPTKEASRRVRNVKKHVKRSDLTKSKGEVVACLDPMTDARVLGEANSKTSELDLEYGLDDALEVARRVGKEVEQEVVDNRKAFCSSSSEKNSGSEISQPCSLESVEDEHDSLMVKTTENEMSMENDGRSYPNKRCLQISVDNATESEHQMNDSVSPKSAAVTQETDGNNDKSRCDFDLNEDVYTEEIEHPVTVHQPNSVSAPIPVVATAKGTLVFPTAPLHFGGEMGWRGSAETSAFRPASPRRTPDCEKTSFIEGSSNSSKRKHCCLEIDLNVAEGSDDAAVDLASSVKHAPVLSGVHSGDDSAEVSSRRARRLKLDLNSVGEDDACAFSSSDCKVDRKLYSQQNGIHGSSPASSSSSRQTPIRDFDLNDNPSFFDARDSSDYQHKSNISPFQDMNAYGCFKPDNPVVSIMGSKIDVSSKACVNQTHSFLANGQGIQQTVAASLARMVDGSGAQPALSFTPMPHPTYSYNGFTMGPTMPFSPQMYGTQGSAPYVLRGSSLTPQMMSSSSLQPSFVRPPFFMGITDAPSSSNGVGFSHSGLDLNSGVTSIPTEGKEMGTFRQLFVDGPGSLMEERMKSAAAGMGLKRKEPECAWELNMVGYK